MKKLGTTLEEREAFVQEIRLCYWRLLRLLDDRDGDGGLTDMQLILLKTLHAQGPISSGGVCELLQVTPADVTGLSSRLEKKGCVRRTRDSTDHRLVLLSITPTGIRAMEQSSAWRDRVLDQVLRELSPLDRSRLVNALEKLRSGLDRSTEARPVRHIARKKRTRVAAASITPSFATGTAPTVRASIEPALAPSQMG